MKLQVFTILPFLFGTTLVKAQFETESDDQVTFDKVQNLVKPAVVKTCVTVISAKNLANTDADLHSPPDPFVRLWGDGKNMKQTTLQLDETNPVWKEKFCFPGLVEQFRFLVLDMDSKDRTEEIGSASLKTVVSTKKNLRLSKGGTSGSKSTGTLTVQVKIILQKKGCNASPNQGQVVQSQFLLYCTNFLSLPATAAHFRNSRTSFSLNPNISSSKKVSLPVGVPLFRFFSKPFLERKWTPLTVGWQTRPWIVTKFGADGIRDLMAHVRVLDKKKKPTFDKKYEFGVEVLNTSIEVEMLELEMALAEDTVNASFATTSLRGIAESIGARFDDNPKIRDRLAGLVNQVFSSSHRAHSPLSITTTNEERQVWVEIAAHTVTENSSLVTPSARTAMSRVVHGLTNDLIKNQKQGTNQKTLLNESTASSMLRSVMNLVASINTSSPHPSSTNTSTNTTTTPDLNLNTSQTLLEVVNTIALNLVGSERPEAIVNIDENLAFRAAIIQPEKPASETSSKSQKANDGVSSSGNSGLGMLNRLRQVARRRGKGGRELTITILNGTNPQIKVFRLPKSFDKCRKLKVVYGEVFERSLNRSQQRSIKDLVKVDFFGQTKCPSSSNSQSDALPTNQRAQNFKRLRLVTVGCESNYTKFIPHIQSEFDNVKLPRTCEYWKEDIGDYTSDGCVVGQHSNTTHTECICQQLTVFNIEEEESVINYNRLSQQDVRNLSAGNIGEHPVPLICISVATIMCLVVLGLAIRYDIRHPYQAEDPRLVAMNLRVKTEPRMGRKWMLKLFYHIRIGHPWFSVFTRRWDTGFLSIERTMVLYVFILTVMVTDAFFYGQANTGKNLFLVSLISLAAGDIAVRPLRWIFMNSEPIPIQLVALQMWQRICRCKAKSSSEVDEDVEESSKSRPLSDSDSNAYSDPEEGFTSVTDYNSETALQRKTGGGRTPSRREGETSSPNTISDFDRVRAELEALDMENVSDDEDEAFLPGQREWKLPRYMHFVGLLIAMVWSGVAMYLILLFGMKFDLTETRRTILVPTLRRVTNRCGQVHGSNSDPMFQGTSDWSTSEFHWQNQRHGRHLLLSVVRTGLEAKWSQSSRFITSVALATFEDILINEPLQIGLVVVGFTILRRLVRKYLLPRLNKDNEFA